MSGRGSIPFLCHLDDKDSDCNDNTDDICQRSRIDQHQAGSGKNDPKERIQITDHIPFNCRGDRKHSDDTGDDDHHELSYIRIDQQHRRIQAEDIRDQKRSDRKL